MARLLKTAFNRFITPFDTIIASEKKPANPFHCALSLEKSGKTGHAIAEFEKCIKLGIAAFPANLALARLYLQQSDIENAERAVIAAMKLKPCNRDTFILLAKIFEFQSDNKSAVLAYKGLIPDTIAEKYFATQEKYPNEVNHEQSRGVNRQHLIQPQTYALRAPKAIHMEPPREFRDKTISFEGAFIDCAEKASFWFDGYNRALFDQTGQAISDQYLGNKDLIATLKNEHKPIEIRGRVVALSGRGNHNYYHWISDILPGVELVRKAGFDLNSISKFVVLNAHKPFHKQTLAHFGIGEDRLHIVDESGPWITADEILVPHFANVMGRKMGAWIPQFLQSEFVPDPSGTIPERRLYIARSAQGARSIENEQEITGLLNTRGFEIAMMEKLTINQQARLLSESSVVVAPHGAGLTNILYCPQGTKIVEIFGPHIAPCYWAIANLCGFEYYHQRCTDKEPDNTPFTGLKAVKTRDDRRKRGFKVNLDEFEQLLDLADIN